jgi:hypothetical protein
LIIDERDDLLSCLVNASVQCVGDEAEAAPVGVFVFVLPGIAGQVGRDDEVQEQIESVVADDGPLAGSSKLTYQPSWPSDVRSGLAKRQTLK